jgi:hypothetical protein
MATTSLPAAPPKVGGRPLLWLGLLAAVAGVPLYAVQVNVFGNLRWPWTGPALASLGAALILLSLGRRLTAWRVLAFLFAAFFAGAGWWFLLSFAKLPSDTGRLVAKQEIPEFTAYNADGSPFTQEDFKKGDKDSVLVFYRGRW